ncbi:MAG: dicarboxylate/amino acid:cation symporter [Sphingomicrobium sp.]
MSDASEAALARKPFGVSAWVIVAALVLGLAAGMGANSIDPRWREIGISVIGTVGGLWLDALKMTVIPLVVALLVKGIVGSAEIASEGRVATLAILWFLGLYFVSAVVGGIATPILLGLFPLSPAAQEAMRAGFAAVNPHQVQSSVASFGDFVRSFIPSNPIASASNGDMLPIVVFTLFLALALTVMEPARRKPVVDFFRSLGDAMLVIIGWVLRVAPIGVFALAFVAGAASGTAVFAAVIRFVVLYIAVGLVVIAVAYAVAVAASRFNLSAFSRAMAPTQAIAFSTQSSTGSLPVMLLSARRLGVTMTTADTVLPLAAALFRVTGPAMNIAVVIFIADVLGLKLGIGPYAAGIAVATFASISAPGLPGQVSYFTSIAPIAMAMGVPIAPLGMLIAVEPVPDMFRTVGNVTMDVAVAGAVDRATSKKGKKKPKR